MRKNTSPAGYFRLPIIVYGSGRLIFQAGSDVVLKYRVYKRRAITINPAIFSIHHLSSIVLDRHKPYGGGYDYLGNAE
jgi:hypothetical protein